MKGQVIAVLREIALLLELTGENPHKVRAYLHAAQTLEKASQSLEDLIQNGELKNLQGIGRGIAAKILDTVYGHISPLLLELRSKIPADILNMLEIPGLGPKKVRALREKLHIETVEELGRACADGRVSNLPGFSHKTACKILSGIESFRKNAGLFLFEEALSVAREIVSCMRDHPAVGRIEIAGSLRRNREVVKGVNIVAAADDAPAVVRKFASLMPGGKVLAQSENSASIEINKGLQVDLRVVPPAEFPCALLYFTGSREHNVAMSDRAAKFGLQLNERGLFRNGQCLTCRDEVDVFTAIGLPYITPELREGQGELAAAERGDIPKLVTVEDLKGIFHIHTTYSDGVASLLEVADWARHHGFQYIGITDHSQSLTIGNGMKPETVLRQFAEIDELNQKLKPFRIFKGIESDILADGSLDYEPEMLAMFDFVIASIHGQFAMSQAKMTERIIRALANPFTTMLGHPTCRLLLKRDPIAVDMHAVIDAAARSGVVIEVNTHPLRLDLDWRLGQYARERNLIGSVNPDAHAVSGFEYLPYGVGIARKGWFEPERILNTLPLDKIEQYFSARKG